MNGDALAEVWRAWWVRSVWLIGCRRKAEEAGSRGAEAFARRGSFWPKEITGKPPRRAPSTLCPPPSALRPSPAALAALAAHAWSARLPAAQRLLA